MNYSRYRNTIAITYSIVLFLDRLDLTIVNITLPTVAKYFGVPIIVTDWISLAFLLALAISIPLGNWLSNKYGTKIIYVLAMCVFGLGSTLSIFANSLNQLIILRFLQGIGGGVLIPVGMTIIYRLYDKSEYASITSFMFIPSLIAPAVAPFFGGIILDIFGWKSVFVCSGPICLFTACYSWIYLRADNNYKFKYPLDKLGFILLALILLIIFYCLSQVGRSGLSLIVIIEILALLPLSWLFIQVEKKIKYPLINLDYFKNSIFIKANLVQLCFQFCHFGAIFLIGMFLQMGVGFIASLAGLMMGMQAVGAILISRYSVRLFNRYNPQLPIIIGLLGIAVLSPLIMLVNSVTFIWFGLGIFLIRGLFSGLCGVPIQVLSVINFDKSEVGEINGIFNICRQISISLGVAISSLLISLGLYLKQVDSNLMITKSLSIEVFQYGFYAISVVALLGVWITSKLDLKNLN